jgi:Uncharacterized protein involved in benzoate metabolism
MLTAAGLATTVGSVFGAYTLNLSAITAAMMAGPDAHPDRERRWIATVSSGIAYLLLGLGAGAATALGDGEPADPHRVGRRARAARRADQLGDRGPRRAGSIASWRS